MGAAAHAIEQATGVAWGDWTAWLEQEGAAALPHAELARLVRDRLGQLGVTVHAVTGKPLNDGWWAQSIAIDFEHDHGMRAIGQDHRGDFAASASRTVVATLDEALAMWIAATEGLSEAGGVPFAAQPSISATEKWRYWRVPLADGTRVQVDISARRTATDAAPRSVVAVQHSRLLSAEEIPQRKLVWKEILAGLAVSRQPGT